MGRRKKPIKNPILLPDELKALGETIYALRSKTDRSQLHLANTVGISCKTLSNLENGRYWPSVPVLLALRRELTGTMGKLI